MKELAGRLFRCMTAHRPDSLWMVLSNLWLIMPALLALAVQLAIKEARQVRLRLRDLRL